MTYAGKGNGQSKLALKILNNCLCFFDVTEELEFSL